MLIFQWQDMYLLGEESIDREHQHLFKLANEVFSASENGADTQMMCDAVKELFFYMETHFKNEEAFMLKCNYPNRREHLHQHQQIIAEMNSALKHFDSVEAYLSLLRKMMIYWVVDHIVEHDQKIGRWLEETEHGKTLTYASSEA